MFGDANLQQQDWLNPTIIPEVTVSLSQWLQNILSGFNFTMIRRRVERGRYLWDANKVCKDSVTHIEKYMHFVRISGTFCFK
jgi:hypothetical protein